MLKINNYVSTQTANTARTVKNTAGSKDFATQFAAALKTDEGKKLYEACQDLESVFVSTVLKTMRQSVQKSGLMGSSFADETYQSMLDEEYAKEASRTNSLGIAQTLFKQLSQQLPNQINQMQNKLESNPSSKVSNPTVNNDANKALNNASNQTVNQVKTKYDSIVPPVDLGSTDKTSGDDYESPDSLRGPADGKYIDFTQPNWQIQWNAMWGEKNKIVTQSTRPDEVGKNIADVFSYNCHPVIYAAQAATGVLSNGHGQSVNVNSSGQYPSSNKINSNNYSNNNRTLNNNNNNNDNKNDFYDFNDGWAS